MAGPKMEVEVPDSYDFAVPAVGEQGFQKLVIQRQAAVARIKASKAEVKECDALIGVLMDINKARSATCNEWLVSRRESAAPRKSVDPMKLLELGVSPAVIQAATVYGDKGTPGISVRRASGIYGSDEEEA